MTPIQGYQCYKSGSICDAGPSRVRHNMRIGCRYWVRCGEWGNCVLRIRRGEELSQDEVAEIEGVSKQAVQQAEKRALMKIGERLAVMREMQRQAI